MEYQVIVPNLERRTDRWLTCLGILIGQEVPSNRIIRFLSYDGANYKHVQEARDEALAMHDTPYFRMDMTDHVGVFCCKWTFYSILRAIADGIVGNEELPTLFLIDDMRMKFNYNQIKHQINVLSSLESPFRIIQYNRNPIDPSRIYTNFNRPEIESLPGFQKGIGGPGDWATMFTSQGARDLLALIDSDGRFAGKHLCHYIWHFGNKRNQEGCYSVKENAVSQECHPYTDSFRNRKGGNAKRTWRIERKGRIEFIRK